MQIRKWLALLVSAALALSLLAGCGGKNQSLAQVILDLLDGQYANVTVEIDPDLEADLRQAVHEGETDEEIRAALEKILGSGVSFRLIGDGQQGDTAWSLILYPGSDPDAAARSAFTEWNKVFGSLPRDGQYSAGLAMLETENGYAILVKATVDKAASRDDDDDDDEPEDEKVEGNGFTYNVTDGIITMKSEEGGSAENGLQELFFDAGVDDKVKAARADGFAGVTIELAAGSYSVKDTFGDENTPFMGTLKGEDKETTIIKLTDDSNGLFAQIGKYAGGTDDNGTVENITFDVQTNITDTYAGVGNHFAGAVAGINYGNITNCDVTINGGHTIKTTRSSRSAAAAGGLVGWNDGTITDCKVTIDADGSIQADGFTAYAGGIAGDNQGKIKGKSQVTIESGSIRATGTIDSAIAYAGGLAGQNRDTVDDTCSFESNNLEKTITAKVGDGDDEASVPDPTDTSTPNTDTKGDACAGTKIGYDWNAEGPVG